ncbi:hypothetical protein Tco_0074476 [Tanacetum coccineum]
MVRRVASQVNTLLSDRREHAHTRLLMETEARICQRLESYSQQIVVDRREISDLLETDRGRHTTERDDSTSGTGHHTAGAGDSLTGTGDGITGAGYCITGTAGTRWGPSTARAAKGGVNLYSAYYVLRV